MTTFSRKPRTSKFRTETIFLKRKRNFPGKRKYAERGNTRKNGQREFGPPHDYMERALTGGGGFQHDPPLICILCISTL